VLALGWITVVAFLNSAYRTRVAAAVHSPIVRASTANFPSLITGFPWKT